MAQFAPSPSVYVGGLDQQVTEQILYDHFKSIGPIVSVRVCLDSQTQKSLGYGYVNFQNPADAEAALDKLNGSKLLQKFIRVAKIQRDPTQRRTGVTNIIVKRLPPTVDVPTLRDIFSKFGRISSAFLAADENNQSRGYAYVMFEREESAVEAVAETNGMEIEGKPILVERYRLQHREEQLSKFTNLFIKNLALNVTDDTLKEYFSRFGEVTSAKIRADSNTKESMGCGYVAFASHEAAAKAVEELNEKPCDIAAEGQTLGVRRFQTRQERTRTKDRLRREKQLQHSKYPNLYVKNFDEFVTSDRLKELFEKVGPTISVRVMTDPTTKVSRCFGFVSMRDQQAANRAIQELSGSTFLGSRPLFVTYALRKDARRAALEEMQKKARRVGGPGGPPGGPAMGMYAPMGGQGAPMGGQMFSQPTGMMPTMTGMGAMPMGGIMNSMNLRGLPMGAPVAPMMNRPPMLQHPSQVQQPLMQRRPQPKPAAMAPQMAHPHHVVQQPMPAAQQQQSLASLLASMNPEQQKNVLGERLYTYIYRRHPQEAAKVTGMLLEMDNGEILNLLDGPELLDSKINEALEVLERHAGN